jgi:hypothetical protein
MVLLGQLDVAYPEAHRRDLQPTAWPAEVARVRVGVQNAAPIRSTAELWPAAAIRCTRLAACSTGLRATKEETRLASRTRTQRSSARTWRSCAPISICDEEIRLACNLFADHVQRQHEIERFWLEVTGLPRSSLCNSIVNVYSKHSLKKRTNKLPYGTCRVVVNRTRVVQSIYGAIQEYAGFDRPAWLDA